MSHDVPVPHPQARCCWCHGPLYKISGIYWCRTEACWRRQASHSLNTTPKRLKQITSFNQIHWLNVPLPKQCEFEEAHRSSPSDGSAFHVLFGGHAGPGKSHGARWSMYRRALACPGYEGLLLRRTFPELEKTHLRRMSREEVILKNASVPVSFAKTDKLLQFGNGSLIECGHMDDEAAVDKYLSTEYDDIVPDEAATFPSPEALLELSTRARSTKPQILAAGGPWFRPVTNPGGPSSRMLLDFFIDHTPDLERYPRLAQAYRPDSWVYIDAALEDNPYLGEGYETTLAVLSDVRYRQLREGDWRVFSGQFFTTWREATHVRSLGLLGGDVSWTRSIDWGRTSPGCVGWYAHLPDHRYHRARELKFIDRDIAEVASDMKRIDQELGIDRVRYTMADPAIFNRGQETGEAIAETFARCGVPLTRANNNRLNGAERCRALLRCAPDGSPYFTVDPSCVYFRRTIPLLQSAPNDPEDVDTSMDDHAYDEWRYWSMSRPAPHRFAVKEFPKESLGAWREELRSAVL